MDINQQKKFDKLAARRKVLEAKIQPWADELQQVCRELRSIKSSEAARLKRLENRKILDKRILDFLTLHQDDYRAKRPGGLIGRAASEFKVGRARIRALFNELLATGK